jgi:hypothetical protein
LERRHQADRVLSGSCSDDLCSKALKKMVGARGFEPPTPSPPD